MDKPTLHIASLSGGKDSTAMLLRMLEEHMPVDMVIFCDTGIAAYLLGIETPAQMGRDPLMGQLFENMIVMEAVKAEYDNNIIDSLFFFRNSNGVEVDLLHKRPEGMNLFEVKSSMSISKDFLKGIDYYRNKFGAASSNVIYAGESCPEYLGSGFVNFHKAYDLFIPKTEKFRLNI